MRPWLRPFVQKYLDPADSLDEILFGLIMVLTFTLGTGLATGGDPDAGRTLMISAIGCNIAWGLIDGVMYVMTALFERSRLIRLGGLIRSTPDDATAGRMIAGELDDQLAAFSTASGREAFYVDVVRTVRATSLKHNRVQFEDLMGAVASFLLVFLTALPGAIPFVFITNAQTALLVSNGILLAMLFGVGYSWGRTVHTRPLLTGTAILLLGVGLVAIAQVLGG